MKHVAHPTIELGRHRALCVEIVCRVSPGDARGVWRQGGPDSLAEATLSSVRVLRWMVVDDDRKRGTHWAWEMLDAFAMGYVTANWGDISELILVGDSDE